MTESNDPKLAGQCAHCGKVFPLHHYTNRYGKARNGKSVPAKYCSAICRKDRYRVTNGYSRCVPRVDDTDVQARCVPPSLPVAPAPRTPLKTDDAFARLQGNAVLSQWKPSGDGKDVPNIPDFLRR